MAEWLPIEAAPKDGTRVLAWWPHLGEPTIGWHSDNRHGIGWRAYTRSTSGPVLLPMPPTLWKPLVPPAAAGVSLVDGESSCDQTPIPSPMDNEGEG